MSATRQEKRSTQAHERHYSKGNENLSTHTGGDQQIVIIFSNS